MNRILLLFALFFNVKVMHAQFSITLSKDNVSCYSNCDGSITVSATGGVAPYTYTWNSSLLSGPVVSSLCPGKYTVTVKDGSGFSVTDSVTITENPPISITVTTSPSLCGDSTGTALATATGGTGDYRYQFDMVSHFVYDSYVTGLAPGVYCITVTDDNGCFSAACAYIDPIGGIEAKPLTVSPATCPGRCDGVLEADTTRTGFDIPFTISWKDEEGNVLSHDQKYSGACSGEELTLYVENAKGCKDSANMLVDVLPPPSAQVEWTPRSPDLFDPVVTFTALPDSSVISLQWTGDAVLPGAGNFFYPEFADTGWYEINLQLTNHLGCMSLSTFDIYVKGAADLFFPNAFSPNGDGKNDVFNVKGYGFTSDYKLMIFDRNGTPIFETNDPMTGWDGSVRGHYPVPGVYVWQLRQKDKTGKWSENTGVITLIP